MERCRKLDMRQKDGSTFGPARGFVLPSGLCASMYARICATLVPWPSIGQCPWIVEYWSLGHGGKLKGGLAGQLKFGFGWGNPSSLGRITTFEV